MTPAGLADLAGFQMVPMGTWPGDPTVSRTHSPFRATFTATLSGLGRELRAIGADEVVLQMGLTAGDLRRDGSPRANARPWHPGVILTFTAKPPGSRERFPLRYACDRFWEWKDNLRAIALGLEALRKVDRYGITAGAEQYAGFRLTEGRGVESGVLHVMTRAEAEAFLAAAAGLRRTGALSGAEVRELYRRAAKSLHPDTPSGSRGGWDRLQQVKEVLFL